MWTWVSVAAFALAGVASCVWLVKAVPRPAYRDSDDDHMYVGW